MSSAGAEIRVGRGRQLTLVPYLTAAATIHPRLRSISGICSSLLGMSGPRSTVHIHILAIVFIAGLGPGVNASLPKNGRNSRKRQPAVPLPNRF
jgi:hypothetical protein